MPTKAKKQSSKASTQRKSKAQHLTILKKTIWSLCGIIVLIGIIATYQLYTYIKPNFSTNGNEATYLYIEPDCNYDSIVSQIEHLGVATNINSFSRWATLKKYPSHIKTGRYKITNGMSNKELIHNLSAKIQAPVKVKINNVRTLPQLASKLGKQLMVDSVTLMNTFTDPNILLEYNIKQEELIAFFIPNTYEIYWDIEPCNIVKRMNYEYKHFWNEERLQKAKDAKLSPIEVITLASIVEEETNRKVDKPIIAGLYINRLRIGMCLQACPTAKYASGDFSLRRILHEHTQIDSPYNTYKYRGLPPGPIRTPSIESIDAVLNYDHNKYLYMCAKETRNGEHYYASNYAEHTRNARKYQQAVYNKK